MEGNGEGGGVRGLGDPVGEAAQRLCQLDPRPTGVAGGIGKCRGVDDSHQGLSLYHVHHLLGDLAGYAPLRLFRVGSEVGSADYLRTWC